MFFIDVQGTLIDDNTKLPLRGAVEFINHLNQICTPYVVITNSTKYSSEVFLTYLNDIGLKIPKTHYIDPLMVLKGQVDVAETIFAYGSPEFLKQLTLMGYVFDTVSPKTVLISIKEDFCAQEYSQMIELVLSGARLVGMHETSLYVKNGKRYVGVGAILRMIEFATQTPYAIVGKPSLSFFNSALDLLRAQHNGVEFSDVTIISDDVSGDVLPAQALGMRGVFVLSGKYRSASEILPQLASQPHSVYDDIQAVLESL
jgi:NagD protein